MPFRFLPFTIENPPSSLLLIPLLHAFNPPLSLPFSAGKLNAREVHALKQGLENEMKHKASRRDSDLDVDEEYERKMNAVNDTNHHTHNTTRDTISQGSPIVASKVSGLAEADCRSWP